MLEDRREKGTGRFFGTLDSCSVRLEGVLVEIEVAGDTRKARLVDPRFGWQRLCDGLMFQLAGTTCNKWVATQIPRFTSG